MIERSWYRRRDSNPHCLVPKTSASCPLGYAGESRDESGRMKDEKACCVISSSSFIPHPSSFDLVDLARFERAASTFAESRSNSTELQIQEYF
jgi:hypothetical protein